MVTWLKFETLTVESPNTNTYEPELWVWKWMRERNWTFEIMVSRTDGLINLSGGLFWSEAGGQVRRRPRHRRWFIVQNKKYKIMFFTLLIYCPLFLGCMKVLFIHIGQWFGLINLKLHQLQLKCTFEKFRWLELKVLNGLAVMLVTSLYL